MSRVSTLDHTIINRNITLPTGPSIGNFRPVKAIELSPRIGEICERFQVERLEIFGSRARGDAEATSDFDFLVQFKELAPPEYARNYFGLLHALEDELSAAVDLITQPSITKESLHRKIEQEKGLIYAS